MITEEGENGRESALRQLLLETASTDTDARRLARPQRRLIVIGGASALALALVVPLATETADVNSVRTPLSNQQNADDFLSPSKLFIGDYELFVSPSALAEAVPVVISGTVQGVITKPGPLGANQAPEWGQTAILVLTDVQTAKGSLDRRDDNTVHLALPGYSIGQGKHSLTKLEGLFPAGTEVVAFGGRGWLANHSWGVGNVPPPGVDPAVDPTYMVWHPQGLAVQKPTSDLIHWPYLGDVQIGDIADALPSGCLIGQEKSPMGAIF